MTPALLETQNLGFSYAGPPVLEEISLCVRAGEFVGLVGPNGAGKTTLLRLLMGLLRPRRGEVRIQGQPLSEFSRQQVAQQISLVPQEVGLGFSLSVSETVAMGRYPHRGRFTPETHQDLEIVRRALAATSLTVFAERSVNTLSGGERQRVLIARAIAQQTPILLLDEPTANLDVCHQLEVLDLVRNLTARGVGAVATIHDLSLASRYCERLILLAKGRVVASGPPVEVFTKANLARYLGIRARVEETAEGGGLTIVPIAPITADLNADADLIGS